MFEKLLLTVSLVFLGNFTFALKLDTLFGDTSYTLYDLRSDRWVDDSAIEFVSVEPKRVVNRKSNDWMRGPVSGGNHARGANYDSIHNINPKVGGVIAVGFLVFIVYVIFRVRKSLKRDREKEGKN